MAENNNIVLPKGATLIEDSKITLPKGAKLLDNNQNIDSNNDIKFEGTVTNPQDISFANTPLGQIDYNYGFNLTKLLEDTYKKHTDELNLVKSAPIKEVPIKEVPKQEKLDGALKALTTANYLSQGNDLNIKDKIEYVFDPVLNIKVPTVKKDAEVSVDEDPLKINQLDNSAKAATATFDEQNPVEVIKSGTQAANVLRNKISQLDRDIEHYRLVLLNKKLQGGQRKYSDEEVNLAKGQIKDARVKKEYLLQQLTNLNSGMKELQGDKVFSDDLSNLYQVDQFLKMSDDNLFQMLAERQGQVENVLDYDKSIDLQKRASSIDLYKIKRNKEEAESLPQVLKDSPIAYEMLADPNDIYQVDKYKMQSLAYDGAFKFIENINKYAEADGQMLAKYDENLKNLEANYKDNPSQYNLEGYKKAIEERNQYIQSNVVSKQNLADKVQKIIDTKLVDSKERAFLQKRVDELNKTLYGNIAYGTFGTGIDVLYNEAVLGGIAIYNRTNNRIKTALDSQTPQQELSNIERLKEDIDAEKLIMPTEWKTTQMFEWDDKGFRFNPSVSLHSITKTGVESYLLGAGFAAEGLVGKNAVAKYLTGLGSGTVVTGIIFGHDMMSNEEAKGLSSKDAYNIGVMRSLIEAGTEKLFFDEAMLLTGKPISEQMIEGMGREYAFKRAASSYNKLFTKDLSENAFNLIYDTKNFLATGSKTTISEALEEVAGDLGNHILDNQIQKNIKPDYASDNEFTLTSELLTAINTMASMAPTGVKVGYDEHNNAIKTARYTIATSPNQYLHQIKENLKNNVLTKEQAASQIKLLSDLQTVHSLLGKQFEEVDKSDLSPIEKERNKIELFNHQLAVSKANEEILKDPSEENVNFYTKVLNRNLDKIKKIQDVVNNNVKLSQKQIEKKRVKEVNNYIENELSDIVIERIKTLEDVNKMQSNVKAALENEQNEELKSKFQTVIQKLDNQRKAVLTGERPTEQEEKNTSIVDSEKERLNKLPTDKLKEELETNNPFDRKDLTEDQQEELYNHINSKIDENTVKEKTITFGENNYEKGEFIKIKGRDGLWQIQSLEDGKLKVVIPGEETSSSIAVSDPLDISKVSEDEKNTFFQERQKETKDKSNDLEAKKADIERRRQEELETTKNIGEDKLKEGRENTKKLVESLKQRYPATSVQGIIIRILEKLIDFSKYSTIIDSDYLNGRNASGQATWFGMMISQETFDGILAGKEFEVHTFIHEFIHGFTTSKISDYNIEKQGLIPGFKSKLTAKEKHAIEQLQRIFEKVKKDNPKSKEYGFTNLDEFIAEAFSNTSFQYTLKNTKAEGKKSNLFSEFLEAIGDLLFEQLERWAKRFNKEIPERSTITGILEDVLAWTEDLIDQNNKLAYIATNEEINAKYDAELAALEKNDNKQDIKRRKQEILDNYKNKIEKENPELSNNSIEYKVYKAKQFLNAIENDVFLIKDVKEIAKELFGTELKISDAGTLLFANNDKYINLAPNILKSKLKDALSSSQFTLEHKQKGKIGLGDKLTKEQVDILYKAINAKYDAKLKALEQQPTISNQSDIEAKKADTERRRQELESSREIETLYDLTKPITEDSKEIISKIEEANKLRKEAKVKSEQAAKETNEEKRIALNSDANSLNEKAQILDKEVKASRDSVINNTPIKQAITSAKILGQKLLNKIKLAAKSNEWVSSMPISKEEFTKLEDATKRLSVKSMGEVTSNSEVIPDILLVEEINAKYDAELATLDRNKVNLGTNIPEVISIDKMSEDELNNEIQKNKSALTQATKDLGEDHPFLDEIRKNIDSYQKRLDKIKEEKAKASETDIKIVNELNSPEFNPFRTISQQQREGVDASQSDDVVLTQVNTFNKFKELVKNGDNLTKLGYYITVMNNDLPMNQQNQSVIQAFNEGKIDEGVIRRGRIAVITDKEGNILQFDKQGNEVKTNGLPVYQNLNGRLKDGKLVIQNEPSESKLKELGLLENYNNQKLQLEALRSSTEPITFEIGQITQGFETTGDSKQVKASTLSGYKPIISKNGRISLQDETGNLKTTLPPLIKETGLTDSLIAMMDMNNKEGLPENLKNNWQNRRTYLEAFIYTKKNLRRIAESNNKLFLNTGINNTITITQDELKDYIDGLTMNIDVFYLGRNFTTYTWDGTKFTPSTKPYEQFLMDNLNTMQGEKTFVNSYLKFGSQVTQITQVKEPVKKEVIREKTAPKEFKKIKRDIKPDPNAKGLKDLLRSKSLTRKTTKEQEQAAKDWFEENLKSTGAKFEDFRDIVNSDAWATWNTSGITLWYGGRYSDTYHEAFHNFTQLFLTPEQKDSLYKELRNSSSKYKDLTDLEAEEILAEDFYNYMLSGQNLILNKRVKRNTIFRRLYNFLKEWFTGKPSIEVVYQKLATNNIAKYKYNLDNAIFGTLNKNRNLEGLTIQESNDLRKALDSYLADKFRQYNLSISNLFKSKKYLDGAYQEILNDLSHNYQNYEAEYNSLVEKYNNASEDDKDRILPEVTSVGQLVSNLAYTIENWNNVKIDHLENSEFLKVSKKYFPDEFFEGEDSETKDAIYDDRESESAKDRASDQIIYLIASLPKYKFTDGKAEVVKNKFIDIIDDVSDFTITWNKIAKNLSGIKDYNRQWQKLQEISKENPEIAVLLESLPNPNATLDLLSMQLRNQFINVFSQPYVPMKIVNFRNTDNGLKVSADSATPTALNKLKNDWDIAIQESNSPYIVEVNGQKSLDIENIVKDFKGVDKRSDKSKIEFLEILGITLSPQTKESPEFLNLLKNSNTIAKLYNGVKQLNDLRQGIVPKGYTLTQEEKERFSKPIYSFINAIQKTVRGKNNKINISKPPVLIEGLIDTALMDIADIELKYSERFFSDNLLNANGDSVWAIRPWSQQSTMYSILNNVEKYPNYESLKNDPVAAYFHKDFNPDADNAYIRALFNLETGERIKDKEGKPISINLYNHNGLRTSIDSERDGFKTTNLSRFGKLVQDISVLINYGNKEHIRYGDKTTSNGTEVIFRRLSESKARNPYLPVDVIDFESTILPEEAWLNFRQSLVSALQITNDFYSQGIGKNYDNLAKNINDWSYFDGILSKSTVDKIKSEGIETKSVNVSNIIDKYQNDIKSDIEDFLEKRVVSPILKELNSNKVVSPEDYIDNYIWTKYGKNLTTIVRGFTINSYIMNMEHTRLIFQDPRFYKNKAENGKKSYRELFKRVSKASSTGGIAINDEQVNRFLTQYPRYEREVYNQLHPENPAPELVENGVDNSVIFDDVEVSNEQLLEHVRNVFKNNPLEERLAIEKKYSNFEPTDAFGFATFDWYRNFKIRTGNDEWNNEAEQLYRKIVNGEELSKEDELNSFKFFAPVKIRQVGYTFDSESKRYIPIDYKFAVSPLLSSVVKDKSFGQIRDNMLRQNISLATFASGSKHSAIANSDKLNHNKFYNEDGSVFNGDYVVNPVFIEYTYEVVASPKGYKEYITFSTQLRKLLFSDMFENGIPIDFKGKDWNSLSESEKLKQSSLYKLEQDFGNSIDRVVETEKNKLIKKLNIDISKDNWEVDQNKLSELLEEEFDKRGLPQNLYQSIQVVDGKFKYSLDSSTQRETIEQIILSIVDNRLRKQKVSGEGLIQVPSIGNETTLTRANKEELAKWDKSGGNDLPFYIENGRTLADGTKVTSAMKIKVALQGDFKKLLNLKDVKELAKNQNITELQALNQLIKDEKWLDKSGVRQLITATGVRIPVQNHNSMEFMEIYEFLPEEAGNIIITSPALVVKSGSDNDWDKISTQFSTFSDKGTLYWPKSEEEIIELKKKAKHISNKFQSEVDRLAEKDEIESNLRDEIETYLFNLFNEDDDIVVEAKNSLEKLLKSIQKSEKKIEELQSQLAEIKDLIDSANPKKGYENQLNSIIRKTLEKPELYKKLITPNATYLFEPIADAIKAAKEEVKPSYSDIPTVQESLNQFESNTVGKASLGIGAIWNTLFSQMQKAGLYLNNNYISNPQYPKERITSNRLKHNLTKNGNTSLSGIYDAKGQYKISEVISQLMNGWVDVAKKDWIFYINGRKEIAPIMLYTAVTGVNKDDLIAFFNQPVLYDFIKSMQNYKSPIVKLKNRDLYQNAKMYAIHETLMKYLPEDQKVLKKVFGKYVDVDAKLELQNLFDRDEPQFYYGFINDQMRELADKNKDLFDVDKFKDFAIPKDGKLAIPSTENEKLAQALYLIQFLELQEQQGIVDKLRRVINQDTEKPQNIQFSKERQVRRAELDSYQLFPKELVMKMANEGTIKAFTHSKNGIDKFIEKLTNKMFEVTNHPVFNKFLFDEFNKPTEKNNIPFASKFQIQEDWVKTVKNDFIYYLYQNYIYRDNQLQKVSDYVFNTLMKYDTSLGKQLENIKIKYPELTKNNLLLQMLQKDYSTTKVGNKPKTVSIKLRQDRIDNNTANILTENFNELLNFQDENYTPEEQTSIQQFAKDLAYFAFIQSGLNKSNISFTNIIPQEFYSHDMGDIVAAFSDLMTTNPDKAINEIQSFYNLFKKNNRNFFVANKETDQETGETYYDIDFANETFRGKDYRRSKVVDLLDKRANIERRKTIEFLESIKSKTKESTEEWTNKTAENNPNTFFVYETSENDGLLAGSAKIKAKGVKNIYGIPLMKGNIPSKATSRWTDDTYQSNIKQIDNAIDTIVQKIRQEGSKLIEFPKGGLINLSKLNESAPETAKYLATKLLEVFGYKEKSVNLDQNTEPKEDFNQEDPLKCD